METTQQRAYLTLAYMTINYKLSTKIKAMVMQKL